MTGRHAVALVAGLLLWPALAAAHAGHTDRQPWDVCAAQTLGADCRWTGADHAERIGTCRDIGGALMCVRNRPIVPEEATTPTTDNEPPGWLRAAVGTLCAAALLWLAVRTRRTQEEQSRPPA